MSPTSSQRSEITLPSAIDLELDSRSTHSIPREARIVHKEIYASKRIHCLLDNLRRDLGTSDVCRRNAQGSSTRSLCAYSPDAMTVAKIGALVRLIFCLKCRVSCTLEYTKRHLLRKSWRANVCFYMCTYRRSPRTLSRMEDALCPTYDIRNNVTCLPAFQHMCVRSGLQKLHTSTFAATSWAAAASKSLITTAAPWAANCRHGE